MNILDKFYGVLLGGACGDILGSQTEGMTRKNIIKKYDETVNTMPVNKLYTDDTEMTLALGSYISQYDTINLIDIHKTYANFMTNKGYSLSTRNIIEKFKYTDDKDFKEYILQLYKGNSSHNGAVMRISPLSLKYYDNDDQLLSDIEHSLYYTHGGSKDAVYASYLHVKVLKELLEIVEVNNHENLESKLDFLFKSIMVTCSTYENLWVKMNIVNFCKKYGCNSITEELLGNEDAFQIKAIDAICCAYYIFFKYYKTPVECVKHAASIGGDTDTIAKIVGEMCGALYGTSWIPDDWRGIENELYIVNLSKKLYDKYNNEKI